MRTCSSCKRVKGIGLWIYCPTKKKILMKKYVCKCTIEIQMFTHPHKKKWFSTSGNINQ